MKVFDQKVIQMILIGILGKYLGNTYSETKNRPIFIIKETNIDDKRLDKDR